MTKLILLTYCFFVVAQAAWASHDTPTPQILVLNSYHQGFKWSDEIIAGIRQPLLQRFKNVNIHIEQMDTKRYPQQNLERLADIYADKYSDLPLDVIITADDNAFNFIKAYRSKIGQAAPLIFCGVNHLSKEKLVGLDNYTGVNETADLKENIDLILRLHPDVQRIVAISDLTTSGGINRKEIAANEPLYSDLVKIDQWYNLSHAELLQQLAALSPNDIVLFTSFFRDRLGKSFEFDEIASEISSLSPVPVYAAWDYNLGYGIIGGKLASGFYQGSAAGEYAVRIINGEAAAALPIKWQSPNRYMFDETVLKRFHINNNDLPDGSILINQLPSDFEKYRPLILSVAATLLLLLGVVLYLMINTQRRIRAEKRLRESEAHYRDLTELLPQAVFEMDEQGRMTYVNQFGLDWSGYNLAELYTESATLAFFHPDDRKRLKDNIADIQNGNDSQGNEYRFIKKDGSIAPVLAYSRARRLANGATGLRGVLVDISNIHRAEQEALMVRLYLQNVVDMMPTILIGTDSQGVISLWNNQAVKTTGISPEDAQGKVLTEILPILANELDRLSQIIAQQETLAVRRVKCTFADEERYWDIQVYPLSLQNFNEVILLIDDVTEQIRIEQVMIQTEKMMTVGGLAAGMAHEINNPLAAIMQNSQVIMRRISSDLKKNHQVAQQCEVPLEKITQYLESRQIPSMLNAILDASSRVADIIQDMLSFSRNEETGMSTNDIHKLIDQAICFAKKEHRQYNFDRISVQKDYADIPPIICFANQIQQVLLNIIKNGAEAMATCRQSTQPMEFLISTCQTAEQVQIEIKDNGPGIPEAVIRRIFEPFYTTKDEGVGTGLGLSISYFIVTQKHNGSIDVESVPGHGATFIIKLPIDPQRKTT